ncbi:Uncharacterized protein FKW44_011659 [Caligus rogercresseyi]|uniref:Histone-lysine methyltransferase SETD7 N-terminal domain-containing protein n=1 Tax=Caligus rogercresseyi TaxID=217165 RepID=A0A7T8HIM1_CALRO|nr:Uncharacterized protein FKW44_011659 [Caligus rogercresseyi]
MESCLLNLEIQRQEGVVDFPGYEMIPTKIKRIKRKSHEAEVIDKLGNLIYRRGESDQVRYSRELEQWIRKMKCSGNGGMKLEQFREVKVGIDTNSVAYRSPSLEPYPHIYKESDFKFKGGKDENGRWRGKGVIEFPNGDTIAGTFQSGYRHGECKIETNRLNLRALVGVYENDRLNGKAKLVFQDGTWLEGYFVDGVLHGFVRYFDAKPHGPCWKIVKGGGCVVGRVDEAGELSGIRIAYVYPDHQTALVGTFTKGILENARVAYLKTVVEDKGIKGPLYEYERPDEKILTNSPLLSDPYESRLVEVRESRIEASTVVAFYYGKPVPSSEFHDYDDWDKNAYKIFDPSRKNGTMDIPIEFRKLKNYCATLAHKTNHSFLPNAEFLSFDHPRFGVIPCLVLNHDVEAGEEIFVHYGYDLDGCPDWYEMAWLKGTYPIPESLKEGWEVEPKKSNMVKDSVRLSCADIEEDKKGDKPAVMEPEE